MKTVLLLLCSAFALVSFSQNCSEISISNKSSAIISDTHILEISQDENGDFYFNSLKNITLKKGQSLKCFIHENNFFDHYHFEITSNGENSSIHSYSPTKICNSKSQLSLMIGDNKIQSITLIIE